MPELARAGAALAEPPLRPRRRRRSLPGHGGREGPRFRPRAVRGDGGAGRGRAGAGPERLPRRRRRGPGRVGLGGAAQCPAPGPNGSRSRGRAVGCAAPPPGACPSGRAVWRGGLRPCVPGCAWRGGFCCYLCLFSVRARTAELRSGG